VAAPRRSQAFPDVPTTAEAGVPGYEVSTWYALWAPRNTPAAIVDKMTAEVQKALNAPEVKASWISNGSETPNLVRAQFGAFVTSEIARWHNVVKTANIKLD
jgi:tripartite-type tricarboxylate transporter receptor subunit TctC